MCVWGILVQSEGGLSRVTERRGMGRGRKGKGRGADRAQAVEKCIGTSSLR